MASEQILLEILAKTEGAIQGISKVKGELKSTGDQAEHSQGKFHGLFARITGGLQGLGGPLGGVANAFSGLGVSGALGMAAVGAGVVGAGVAVAKFGVDAANSFATATASVRALRAVTGGSAEDASRLKFAFETLGVDSDRAGKAIFKLASDIGSGKSKLAEFGIEVVRNRDGTVNLYRTLINVASAYQHTGDATQRAAMLADLFGRRQGLAVVPILKTSREELQRFAEEAAKDHRVFSEDDIAKGRQYQIAMRELDEAFKGLAIEVGSAVAPALTSLARILTSVIHTAESASKAVGGIGNLFGGGETLRKGFSDLFGEGAQHSVKTFADVQQTLAEKQRVVAEMAARGETHTAAYTRAVDEARKASGDYEKVQKRVADALGQEGDAAGRAEDEIGKLTDKTLGAIGAGISFERAQLHVKDAQNAVWKATVEQQQAIAQYGAGSVQAAAATDNLKKAELDLREAQLHVTTSGLKAADSQRAVREAFTSSGGSIDQVRAKLIAFMQENPAVAASVQPIVAWIDALRARGVTHVAVDVNTGDAIARLATISAMMDRVRSGGKFLPGGGTVGFFQSGGAVNAPRGAPVPAIVHGGEYVLSADVVERIRQGGPMEGANVGRLVSSSASRPLNVTFAAPLATFAGPTDAADVEKVMRDATDRLVREITAAVRSS